MTTLTIEQALALSKILNDRPATCTTHAARPVIVRSRDAGVLFGTYAGHDGSTVSLTDARQMWQWRAEKGGTLLDCAIHGVKDSGCKFSTSAATMTVFNACAMIDCSPEAAAMLRKVEGKPWK